MECTPAEDTFLQVLKILGDITMRTSAMEMQTDIDDHRLCQASFTITPLRWASTEDVQAQK
jgi:hypothetical protein